MSDEEKKAMFQLKDLENDKEYLIIEQRQSITTILNLIEKQQKELEDLKDIQQQICNEELFTKEYVDKLRKEIEELKEKSKKCEYYEMVSYELYKNSISKDKIKAKIEEFKKVRDEILKNEKEFNRPMMTYDLKRNDYCEKMLQSLLEKE